MNDISISETKQERKQFYKMMLSLVMPIAFQSLMLSAKNASDAIMLGFQDQSSLSAVALAGQITFVVNLFIIVLTQGTTLLAAQYWGKGDKKAIEMILGLAMKYTVAIMMVFFAAATFFPTFLMRMFTSDPVLISGGADYLRIIGISYVLTGITQVYLCIMRNTGKTAKSTVIGSSAMILNIFLNAIFIFGMFGIPAMGIQGAGIATVIATAIQMIWVVIEIRKSDSMKVRLSYLIKIDKGLRSDFLKYTWPIVGNYFFWGGGVTIYSVIIGHLGDDAVAAYAIANIARNLITFVIAGVAAASGIIVGNELGRNNIGLAKLYAKRITIFSFLCGVASSAVLLLSWQGILNASYLSPTATNYLSAMLLVNGYYILAGSINRTVIGGIFCAGGKSQFGLICDAIVLWVIIIPLGFLAGYVWQLSVILVFIILCLDEVIKVPIVYWYYRKYTWASNITRETVETA